MSDREVVLGRIRAALLERTAGAAPAPAAADYVRVPPPEPQAALVDRLRERVEEFRARVTVVAPEEVPAAIADICARHGARTLVVPEGLPEAWRPPGAVPGEPLGLRELDAVDGVVSACALAIADTGTVVLDGGPGQGARRLTLVPDLHVCVVRAEQIVASVPQAIDRLAGALPRPLTLISGPSATSDIELDRVEGVHGPRRLEVVITRS